MDIILSEYLATFPESQEHVED